jgi:hypothetical protein
VGVHMPKRLLHFIFAAFPIFAERCDLPPDKVEFVGGLPTDVTAHRAALGAALEGAPNDFTIALSTKILRCGNATACISNDILAQVK